MYVCRRVPESQFYFMDISGAILLQIVLIKQPRPFAVEIEATVS